jgi:hypothetical protein
VVSVALAGRMNRTVVVIMVAFGAGMLVFGCKKEESFPNQIPAVVATLGQFHESWSNRQRAVFDSVCTDRELYDALVNALGEDSLAVLSRRIHNPIDSADVVMTVGRYKKDEGGITDRYELELYLRREGDKFWIVAHRLTRSLP